MEETISNKEFIESQSSFDMLKAMVGIGITCALLIVVTYEGTLPRVNRLKAEALEKAIFKVLPGTVKSKTFLLNEKDGLVEVKESKKTNQLIYAGYDKNNKLTGVAISANGQGYADILRILYGYNPENQKVIGFHVLESKETPGLGDKIEKDPVFLSNFETLDVQLNEDFKELKNPVITVKRGAKENDWEVDGITGATISSRAIGNIINTSSQKLLPIIYKNKDVLK